MVTRANVLNEARSNSSDITTFGEMQGQIDNKLVEERALKLFAFEGAAATFSGDVRLGLAIIDSIESNIRNGAT